jgi:adenylate cyclase
MAGNLGSSQRMEFAVIGASVNLASRLATLTRLYPQTRILISGAILALLPERLEVLLLGAHDLRGWPEPLQVYGLLGLRESAGVGA